MNEPQTGGDGEKKSFQEKYSKKEAKQGFKLSLIPINVNPIRNFRNLLISEILAKLHPLVLNFAFRKCS